MTDKLNIAFFGSSLVSSYWNGAATYYRGIISALHQRGHRVTFYEPDAFDRQQHRDLEDPPYARSVVYKPDAESVLAMRDEAKGADLVVKTSGVGVNDQLLEEAVLELQGPGTRVIFWDVDAPATLDRVQNDKDDYFRTLIPRYDLVLTYGGGNPVVEAYEALGARRCVPIYNALDPETHYPVEPDPRFQSLLGFLGNRMPDRESRVWEFFFRPAQALPDQRFLLGGNGWDQHIPEDANIDFLGHVYTRDHNAFNSTPRALLNISRESMARYGFSPATRVFEAAGAGACLITDAWEGIEQFLEPGRECLVAHSGDEVVEHLRTLTMERAAEIGEAALQRIRAEHTYAHRALEIERVLSLSEEPPRITPSFTQSRATAEHPMRLVILGLSITSSWGNGHATTWRSLMRELATRGHDVLFLERDVEWYANHRDLPSPPYGRTALYQNLMELKKRYRLEIAEADAVIVGSYVPEGVAVGEWVQATAQGITAFYDIDTPVTIARLERKDYEYLAPHLIPGYQLYLSFSGGPVLDLLKQKYGAPEALPLYCSVDPELYYPEKHSHRWDLGYLGTWSEDRQPVLDRLLLEPARQWAEGRFTVAGPSYPEDVPWPANVERIEHLPPDRHRHFYNTQRFTLNVTRADMVRLGYAPSVRLFEAGACGVPIISDFWEGLDSFFRLGEEILISQSPSETLGYLKEVSEEDRRRIGANARKRILSQHTSAHRALELEQYLREQRGESDRVALNEYAETPYV